MGQNNGVGAARFLQGVGQDGQAVEGSVVVSYLGKADHPEAEPGGIEADDTEGVAENVVEKL